MSATIDRSLSVVAARQLLRDTSQLPSERVDAARHTVERFYASRPPAHQRCVACGHQRWSEHSAGDDVAWACSKCHQRADLTPDQWRAKRAEQDAAQQAATAAAEAAAAAQPAPRVILKGRLAALLAAQAELAKLEAAAPAARSRVWACQAAVEGAEQAAEEATATAASGLAAALAEGKTVGPSTAGAKARAALADARDALQVAKSARVLVEERLQAAKSQVDYGFDKAKKAVRSVISAERLEDLLTSATEARAEYIDALGSIAWLAQQHAIPDGDARPRQLLSNANTPPSAWPEAATAGTAQMEAALAALLNDPEAPI